MATQHGTNQYLMQSGFSFPSISKWTIMLACTLFGYFIPSDTFICIKIPQIMSEYMTHGIYNKIYEKWFLLSFQKLISLFIIATQPCMFTFHKTFPCYF